MNFRRLTVPATAIGGLGDPGTIGRWGGVRDDGRDESLEADCHGHGEPPRATRGKPGKESDDPASGSLEAPSRSRPFPLDRPPGRPAEGPPGSPEGAFPPPREPGRGAEVRFPGRSR